MIGGQRRSKRFVIDNASVKCCKGRSLSALDKAAGDLGQLLNLSMHGLQFISPSPLTAGDKVAVSLNIHRDFDYVRLTGEVAWAAKVLNNNAHRVGVRFFDPAPEAARKLRALEKEFWPLQKILRRAGVGNFNAKYPTDPNAIGMNLASAPHLAMRGEEYFEDEPNEPVKEAAPERASIPAPIGPPVAEPENAEPEPPELEEVPEVKAMDGAPPPQDVKMVEFEMALPEGETEFDDETSVWVESHDDDYRAWVVRSVKMREGFMCREISVTGSGSLFAKVTSGSRVKVFTPTTIVSSRGTRFVVRTSEHGKKTGVTVIEGEVSISVPKRAKNPME